MSAQTNTLSVFDLAISPKHATGSAELAARTIEAHGPDSSPLSTVAPFDELEYAAHTSLAGDFPAFVLRGTRFMDVPDDHRRQYISALSSLFGSPSDSNVDSDRSGTYVDAVVPSDPSSRDVTVQLGECEAHADESSKLQPEDVVALWCARPASDGGGESELWPTTSIRAWILERYGEHVVEDLRRPQFHFGGKLRQPPRVLRAPILFGEEGVRFRRGTLEDAIDVLSEKPGEHLVRAIDAVSSSTNELEPFRYAMSAGDAVVWMNRKFLHARTDFTDTERLLYRTRCYNEALSNSNDDTAEWVSA